ncbi:HNH endonuclease signature motif containing protein [Sinomicrobium sp. M5D2P9]
MKYFFTSLLFFFFFPSVCTSQETYKQDNTEYYSDRYYTTTGKPMVKRSEANKRKFLASKSLTEVPEGYEIDHIIPLSEGGTDDPENMQLLTIAEHREKMAKERAGRSKSTYPVTQRTYYTSSTYPNTSSPGKVTTTSGSAGTDSEGRTLYRGSRGGMYYINKNGNKVYVKSGKESSGSYGTTSTSSGSRSASGRTIHTGPRGGKYYINSKGNKTYVKKKS